MIKHLFLYRVLCEAFAQQGRAISASELMRYSDIKRGSLYSYLNSLIDAGFVNRVERGWYVPVDIYQWHMDDFKENAK